MKSTFVVVAGAVLAVAAVSGAEAQTVSQTSTDGSSADAADAPTLSEVVVTAERHSESVQKVAAAVTALDGQEIQQRGDSSMAEVLQSVPSVILQTQDNIAFGGPATIAIRGIGTDSGAAGNAMYQDGVLVAQSGAFFYDLNRVEVLRGPQGTLYGQGSVGGAINIVENEPTREFTGSGQLEYGSYDLVHTTGVFNAPLSDDLAMRVAFNQIKHNGFAFNGYGNQDELNTRVKLLYRPSDSFSLLVGAVVYRSDDAGPPEVVINPDGSVNGWNDADPTGGNKHIAYTRYYANLVWNVGPFDITYIPAYQTDSLTGDTYGGPGKIVDWFPQNSTQTHELRFSSPDGSRVQWVGGAYYFLGLTNSVFNGSVIAGGTAPDFNYLDAIDIKQQQRNMNTAVFGEVTYPVTDALKVTGGIRETWTRIPYSEQDFIFFTPADYNSDTTYQHFDWKGRLSYDLSPSNMVYGSVSTGSRSGGPSLNGGTYGPETMKAFEIGSKNRFLDNRVQVNVAAYYYNYGGFQQAVPITAPNNPSVIIGEGVATVPARFGGVELETIFQLTPNDQLQFSPAFEKGHYTSDYSSAGVVTYTDGKTPTHMPEWMLSADYSHRFDLPNGYALTAMADVHYQSEQTNTFNSIVFDNGPNANFYITGAYSIADASLTYGPRDGRYSFSAYVRNLTNTEYKLDAFPGPIATSAYVNAPRTFGVIVSGRF